MVLTGHWEVLNFTMVKNGGHWLFYTNMAWLWYKILLFIKYTISELLNVNFRFDLWMTCGWRWNKKIGFWYEKRQIFFKWKISLWEDHRCFNCLNWLDIIFLWAFEIWLPGNPNFNMAANGNSPKKHEMFRSKLFFNIL